MLGLMQQQPLLISSLLSHAARHHASGEVVSATSQGSRPSHHLGGDGASRPPAGARAAGLGVEAQDRVGTLAWNDYRHLEVYYAASGMQAICHTINPRLSPGRHRLHHQPCR